ncbi:hypothetical protein [Ulvibacterium sp.]|uniref:hypothetical protein n=1 Tax=Ulvibacterium sp. TaxID=2665914 RepID=UPI003BAB4228
MKRTFCVFALPVIAIITNSTAQTTIETFAGTDELIIEAWFFKPLSRDYKFTIFSLNDAVIEYDTEEAEFVSYTIIGYDVWKGFGPVSGGRVFDGRASALAGIQWANTGERFLITTNITTEIRDAPFYEWYLLAQYRFPLNEKLNFFGQLQNSTNFNSDSHLFTFQRLRVGAGLKKFQFGLGLNTYQFGNGWDFEIDPGVFLRLEF